MIQTKLTPEADNTYQPRKPTRKQELTQIENCLRDELDGKVGYVKSRDIAEKTGLQTKLVGTLLSDVDDQSPELSITEWARTNSITWRVTIETD